VEVIRRRAPWRHLDAVEYATLEWVDWFNHRRSLGPICNVPPAELERAYYRQKEESAIAAWLNANSLRKTRGGSVRPDMHKHSLVLFTAA
jgi:hypothetical protein